MYLYSKPKDYSPVSHVTCHMNVFLRIMTMDLTTAILLVARRILWLRRSVRVSAGILTPVSLTHGGQRRMRQTNTFVNFSLNVTEHIKIPIQQLSIQVISSNVKPCPKALVPKTPGPNL